MFYKKQKQGEKWYPRTITVGTYDTKEVADRLSRISTVSRSDTYAVLIGLGEVLGEMMESGNSVKLEGLGTFFLVGKANKHGVDTAEEVTPNQFQKLTVSFIPEYRRASNHQVTRMSLVPQQVQWIEIEDAVK